MVYGLAGNNHPTHMRSLVDVGFMLDQLCYKRFVTFLRRDIKWRRAFVQLEGNHTCKCKVVWGLFSAGKKPYM